MSQLLGRRDFLARSAATGAVAGLALGSFLAAEDAPSKRVVVGVMGLSRGRALAVSFAQQPGVEVRYVCDPDSTRAGSCAEALRSGGQQTPQAIADFRRILDDAEVDVLVCAAPNHWHAPATIMGCAAGKHVYVEKPCSHNPHEGELSIQAARKHRRAVQMGSQRRSGPGTIEAMRKLHEGVIGRVYLVRAWYNNLRGSIGIGKPTAVPDHLDYELWQGPAPRQPYLDNRIPYNWHWFWHWGNGELGNNGVHTLDLCRWGLGVDYPVRVVSSGGRYRWVDDQETPDTHTVAFEFEGSKQITWEGLSCNRHGTGFVTFYGEGGALDLESNGTYTVFDERDKEVEKVPSASVGEIEHIVDFLRAIRNDDPLRLNAEIETGHKSTLLCHLGNIAHRTGRTLNCDSANGHIQGDDDAMQLWRREYADGWEPKV
jgi:predicted dehydrogenase